MGRTRSRRLLDPRPSKGRQLDNSAIWGVPRHRLRRGTQLRYGEANIGDMARISRYRFSMITEPGMPRIVVVPGRRSGRAVVRGTRIAVADVLSMLASDMGVEDILEDFPELSRADVTACLVHAAALAGMTDETGRVA